MAFLLEVDQCGILVNMYSLNVSFNLDFWP